jgi:3-hydroxyisobutyrate dehydrogenase
MSGEKRVEPAFYDDLDLTLAEAWSLLTAGAANRNEAFHTPAVATVSRDGTPAVRTVVLRGADPDEWRVRFHTDARAAKVPEIELGPAIEIHAYDAERKIQVRLACRASVHTSDAVAERAWRESPPGCREIYRTRPESGRPLDSPHEAGEETDGGEDAGRGNFCVVDCEVRALEWLYLAARGHRRARFVREDGRIAKTWLVP